MYHHQLGPLTFSSIFKQSLQLYLYCLKYVLFVSLILALTHVIPYFFGFVDFYGLNPDGHLWFSGWGLIFAAALLMVEVYFTGVMFYIMQSKGAEQKVNDNSPFVKALQPSLILYLAMLIYFILFFIGLQLYIIPALFLGVLFIMFIPLILFERQSIFNSFRLSAKLVWGHWWQTFIVLGLPYFLVYFMRYYLRLALPDNHVFFLFEGLILTFFIPYFYATVWVQYHQLKDIKSVPTPHSERHRAQC